MNVSLPLSYDKSPISQPIPNTAHSPMEHDGDNSLTPSSERLEPPNYFQVATHSDTELISKRSQSVSASQSRLRNKLSKSSKTYKAELTRCSSLPLRTHPLTLLPPTTPTRMTRSLTPSKKHILKFMEQFNPPTGPSHSSNENSEYKPVIIISSKAPTSNHQDTLQALHSSITFDSTNFFPAGYRHISDNRLLVEFYTLAQRETAIQQASLPHSSINIITPKTLRPMILLKGINKTTLPETLAHLIPKQNHPIQNKISDSTDLLFKFQRGNRNPKLYNAAFIVTPAIWRAATKCGKLNLNNQRVHVEDLPSLMQCFRCLRFGHTSSKCTVPDFTCSYCSSQTHKYSDCPNKLDPSKLSCHNCNQFYKKKDIHIHPKHPPHGATSNLCPQIQKMQKKIRSITNYGNL